ncbi:AAA family ATPase [Archaeoglobus profundus]|uniref:ATPase associated with various cellular activities AAA_5 n=2 Tax=root TaxID=1 RepID=D2RFD1_ARCPA|nr:AAA family ATPase [Archaeoglobus profundus]ADB58825.1 ATPase associated with various cellular activities AAA_5 [Archaeoglobus profundus DSM 5631]
MYDRNVFIAPGSEEHINKSVFDLSSESGKGPLLSIKGLIPIKSIEDVLTDEEKEALKKIYSDGKVRMWGTRPSLKNTWESIREGDLVVFYSRGRYICAADIVYKTRNPELARKVWGNYDDKTGETWEYIFFVKNVRELNVDRKEFNKRVGYSENFFPQGFMRVNDESVRRKIIELVEEITKGKIPPTPLIVSIIESLIRSTKGFEEIVKLTLAHIVAGKNVVFYGPPGTSKTYLAKKICGEVCGPDNYSFHTANAEWSYFDVVGGLVLEGNGTKFKKGLLLEAVEKCWDSLEKEGKPSWLIIDELNRANLDLAFGKTFTQLDIDYRDMPLEVIEKNGERKEFYMPYSFRILATMNTYDRALLFSLGYAFMRRFAFIPVGSLLKQNKTIAETGTEMRITDEMREFASSDIAKDLRELTKNAILKHFSKEKENGKDRAYIFEKFKIDSTAKVDEIIGKLRLNELDILDVLSYIAFKITNEELVEIGHAIVFDAAKFIVAYSQISPGIDPRIILDEAVVAYILPQLEYFMPKLRRAEIFGEKEYEDKWRRVKEDIRRLGLAKTLKGMEEAEREFKVIQ